MAKKKKQDEAAAAAAAPKAAKARAPRRKGALLDRLTALVLVAFLTSGTLTQLGVVNPLL